MGCSFCQNIIPVDKEVKEILKKLDEKYEEKFGKDNDEDKDKDEDEDEDKDTDLERQLKNRKDELTKLKQENKEITEEVLKNLNEKETKIETNILVEEVDKMHKIFEIGVELTEPMKKVVINKLEKKLSSVPSAMINKINEEINEIKKFKPIEFLESTYGKALKEGLAKKGLSKTVLSKFRKEMVKERKSRRENERKEFNIKVELKDEDDDVDFDLFSLVQKEGNSNFKKELKAKIKEMFKISK
jgi:hypothetical protein